MAETTASLHVTGPSGTTTVDDIPPGGYQFHVTEEPHVPNGTLLGFWLYLMSDCLIFACLFAAYGVLGREYAGGPTGAELFELPLVALNTSFLLLSSITYGFAMLQLQQNKISAMQIWLAITWVFGAAFLAVELYEFAHLIHEGAGPTRSAFLVCLPAGHALARRKSLALDALEQAPFILFPRTVSPHYHDLIIALCVDAGFSPVIRHEARLWQTVVTMVGFGMGVALVPKTLQHAGDARVSFVPLAGGKKESPVLSLRRTGDAEPVASRFLEYLEAAAQENVKP